MAKKKRINRAEMMRLQALHACHLLKAAYDDGEDDGGSVEWESVDMAYREALKALAMEEHHG